MALFMIPPWNSASVLPPIRPGQLGHSLDRSPYRASLETVVERFANSPERIEILRGLIAYRAALSKTIIVDGFQWLNGSFMEHKEILEGEPPKDVDVVTFYQLPEGRDQNELESSNPTLFDNAQVKDTYRVDAYTLQIGTPLKRYEVRQVSYWYSMWSHRRNGVWKGFIQVELSLSGDRVAEDLLSQIEREGTLQ